MIDICVSCDDDPFLDSRLRYSSFHGLTNRNKDSNQSILIKNKRIFNQEKNMSEILTAVRKQNKKKNIRQQK